MYSTGRGELRCPEKRSFLADTPNRLFTVVVWSISLTLEYLVWRKAKGLA